MSDIVIFFIEEEEFLSVYVYSITNLIKIYRKYKFETNSSYECLVEINKIIHPNKIVDCKIIYNSVNSNKIFKNEFFSFLSELLKENFLNYLIIKDKYKDVEKMLFEEELKFISKKEQLSETDDDFKNITDSLILFNLASDYYNGTTVEKNIKKALMIFEKCVELDNIDAIKFLANYYLNIVRDDNSARKYFLLLYKKIDYGVESFYKGTDCVFVERLKKKKNIDFEYNKQES